MSIRSEMTSITSDKIPTRATSYHTSMADSDFPCRAAHELCWRVSRLRGPPTSGKVEQNEENRININRFASGELAPEP